jgi:hypothetical protein
MATTGALAVRQLVVSAFAAGMSEIGWKAECRDWSLISVKRTPVQNDLINSKDIVRFLGIDPETGFSSSKDRQTVIDDCA